MNSAAVPDINRPAADLRTSTIGTSSLAAVHGIIARDLARAFRQKSRLLGGLARPFMWLLFVGTGYNTIARVEGAASYQAFVYPGVIVMAALFGSMLTAISTVYDREFGMLRLMLASPAGVPALLTGRAIAAAAIGFVQGAVVLVFLPVVISVSPAQLMGVVGALALGAVATSVLGLLVAAPLRSVENFAGVINVVLFPLLFLSGALYPTSRLPALLRGVARLNPVTYAVDLMRLAVGQPAEFSATWSIGILSAATLVVFGLTALVFNPEQRFIGRTGVPERGRPPRGPEPRGPELDAGRPNQ
jgi:ABC-2 type transport system permease protein